MSRRRPGASARSLDGGLAICPAGMDSSAETASSVDILLVALQPCRFMLAAAEESALDARLNERLSGSDPELFEFARALASESANDYPNGPLFWNSVADAFTKRLVLGHASKKIISTRGVLSKDVLQRIKDYVTAHLAEPIDVTRLAGIAGRSPFHFSRVFARSVGATPHRYIVHLRLQRAIELVREGRTGTGGDRRLHRFCGSESSLAVGSPGSRCLADAAHKLSSETAGFFTITHSRFPISGTHGASRARATEEGEVRS